jgi:hypothetical protein
MSGSIGASSAVFTTYDLAQVSTHTNAEFNAVNGITDTKLTDKWEAVSSPSQAVDFLNGLTPDQLSQKSFGTFGGHIRVATFATIKDYVDLSQALYNRLDTSDQSSTNNNDLERSDATAADVQRGYAIALGDSLGDNVPGVAAAVTSYLANTTSNTTGSFSKSSVEQLQKSIGAYQQANFYGNWAGNSGAGEALQVLSATFVQDTASLQPKAGSVASEANAVNVTV